MQENVRRIINLAQSLRLHEARENHAIVDLEFARQFLDLVQHRSFAGNRQRCAWIVRQKSGECMKGRRQTFLFNQAAGLDETPFAIGGKLAFAEWKFIKGNAVGDEGELVYVASDVDHSSEPRR